MFDTHCHLNFSRFKNSVDTVIGEARKSGVAFMTVPGTDYETSRKAVELARNHEGVYAAVGIHPHHAASIPDREAASRALKEIEPLLADPMVVAVGEVGIDRHEYKRTKYPDYRIEEKFIMLQKELLDAQIALAARYGKSLILHNWEAVGDMLAALSSLWQPGFEKHAVFHCCEPDGRLLEFALERRMFIGVDGDVTYDQNKADFIRRVPLESLVLETDSPYLLPEPLRSEKKFPNTPSSIPLIAREVARLKGIAAAEVARVTTENAFTLFNLPLTRKGRS